MKIFFDGASRGNPGKAGAGVVIEDEKSAIIRECYRYLGECTNNVAEYQALILSLENAFEIKKSSSSFHNARIDIYSDSELVIRQMKGEYRVKNEGLIPLWEKANELAEKIGEIGFYNIPREENKRADALANKAIDFA